jgi:hypothetical protein
MKIMDFGPIVVNRKSFQIGTFVVDSIFHLHILPKRGSKVVNQGIKPQKIKTIIRKSKINTGVCPMHPHLLRTMIPLGGYEWKS